MAKDINKILNHAIKNNLNVLLKGRHGVGKTAMVQAAFEEAGLKWKYYSASTMDPWVDFIGVPKEKTDADGNTYLDLVRPKDIACDEIEAIFFDELNRSHKKIRNAIMELIQFKSINGKKFKNLKIVWAAINPDDEEGTYDVEKLDPAQVDRFEIQIDIPNSPDIKYFKSKYDVLGERAVKWWNTLDKNAQNYVSPRRLDYALSVMDSGGDVRYVLDYRCNVSSFISTMSKGDPKDICNELLNADSKEISKYLMDNNNYKHIADTMLADIAYIGAFSKHMPTDLLLKELAHKAGDKNANLITYVANNPQRFDHITDAIVGNAKSFAYSDMLIRAFEVHRARKIEQEKSAISKSQEILNVMNKMDSLPPYATIDNGTIPKFISVTGEQLDVSILNVENYHAYTGRRFRATQDQIMRITHGQLTREKAFEEYINKIYYNK